MTLSPPHLRIPFAQDLERIGLESYDDGILRRVSGRGQPASAYPQEDPEDPVPAWHTCEFKPFDFVDENSRNPTCYGLIYK